MRVVGLYPAFDPEMNEMAVAWQRLAATGEAECRVIAGASDVLKNARSAQGVQRLPHLEVLRVPGTLAPGRLDDAAIEWAAQFEPDVIFCALKVNIPHAQRIARRSGARILLYVETWFDSTLMPRRQYLGIPALRPIVARAQRALYRPRVQAVAVSNPREIGDLQASTGVHYLPFPHPHWPGAPLRTRDERSLDTIVYIGSLYRWKGAERLGEYGEHLLRDDPQSRLLIVGPVGDTAARRAVARLERSAANPRLRHIQHLPKTEAMEQIGNALAVFFPHHLGGWGLIGDAWWCGTPVIGVGSHYDLEDGRNALLAPSAGEFVAAVRRLRSDARLWQALSSGGQHTVESKHSVDLHVSHLLALLRATCED